MISSSFKFRSSEINWRTNGQSCFIRNRIWKGGRGSIGLGLEGERGGEERRGEERRGEERRGEERRGG